MSLAVLFYDAEWDRDGRWYVLTCIECARDAKKRWKISVYRSGLEVQGIVRGAFRFDMARAEREAFYWRPCPHVFEALAGAA